MDKDITIGGQGKKKSHSLELEREPKEQKGAKGAIFNICQILNFSWSRIP